MKILLILDDYCLPDAFGGGGDIIARYIYSGLKARGNIVEVICKRDSNYNFFPNEGIHRIFTPREILKKQPLPLRDLKLLKEGLNLIKIVSKFKADVIYCLRQMNIAPPMVFWINKIKIPMVYRIGDWLRINYYLENDIWMRFWKREIGALLNIKFAIFNSKDLLERHRRFISNGAKCIVIPNAVDTLLFQAHKHEFPTGSLKLIFVGRIVPRKGLHILISALKILRSELKSQEIQLSIIGHATDREYLEKLRHQIKEYNLEKAIQWVGDIPHEKIPNYLNEHDILIFPTVQGNDNIPVEGCPLVILEALASGLPIVAKISSGIDEIVKDGESCVGVHNDNPTELAKGVIHLINNPSLYKYLSQVGPKVVSGKHSLENMITNTENFLDYCVRNWKI